ncbi:MAG: aldehyde ferredoxin oxidoreductase C-terminal domain-containing protein [Candidatus Freyarchaeota archaeon]
MGICARAQINRFYYADLYPELYAAATGIEKTREEILRCGERIYNLLPNPGSRNTRERAN